MCRGGRWSRSVSRNRYGWALLLAVRHRGRIPMAFATFAAVTASAPATPSRLTFALIGCCSLG